MTEIHESHDSQIRSCDVLADKWDRRTFWVSMAMAARAQRKRNAYTKIDCVKGGVRAVLG